MIRRLKDIKSNLGRQWSPQRIFQCLEGTQQVPIEAQLSQNPAMSEINLQVNSWHFAKKLCEDSRQNGKPNFSEDDAYKHFTQVTM